MMENAPTKCQAGARDAHHARNTMGVHALGSARRLGQGRSTPLEQPYPFLRKPETTRPAQRLAYSFLRVPSQKRVHIPEYPSAQDDTATAYLFLRTSGELAVPVSAHHCARRTAQREPVSA